MQSPQVQQQRTVLVFGATGKIARSIAKALKDTYRVVGTAPCLDSAKAKMTQVPLKPTNQCVSLKKCTLTN